MAIYPNTLPLPSIDGYSVAPVDQCARTDMEVGAGRVRRRTKARCDVIDASFVYSSSQYAEFRIWFEDDVAGAAGGAAWFDLQVDVDGAVALREVRFKAAWKASRDGIHWRVTAQLEVR